MRDRLPGQFDRPIDPTEFWMRSVSFAGLHRILHALASHTDGLRPGELDALIRDKRLYLTLKGTLPKRTTLYHCRNTLLRIGAIMRDCGRLLVNCAAPEVRALLTLTAPDGAELEPAARELFADMVLRTADCKRHFFDLFMPSDQQYAAADLRARGVPVAWRYSEDAANALVVGRPGEEPAVALRSPGEIKSVVHGVRYWALDELMLIGELFRERDGAVMYPLRAPVARDRPEEIAEGIADLVDPSEEWTSLSVRELLDQFAEEARQPVNDVFEAIRLLIARHPGDIVLIPTSRSMATITARSHRTETLRLKSYFRDLEGRYISHVRLHRSVKGAMRCPTD